MSRTKRTTKIQMELLLNLLEENPIMVSNKTHPLRMDEIENKWDQITEILNSVDNGARKEKKQWKTFLYEWKSKTKKKARLNKKSISQTGGGGFECSCLTDLENRLLSIVGGWAHVVGCTDLVIEPGIYKVDENTMELTADSENHEAVESADLESHEAVESKEPVCETADDLGPEPSKSEKSVPNNPKFKTALRKKLRPARKATSTQLQEAAELYSNSTSQMAEAVKDMAVAISKLAEGLSNIAVALCDMTSMSDGN